MNIFGLDIPTYLLLIIVAVVSAWITLMLLAKKKKCLNTVDVSLTYLMALCGGIIGAVILRPIMRIITVVIEWEYFREVPAGVLLNYITGEIVFYGGLLGGMLAVFIFCRTFKISIASVFDLFVPALALAHAIGRVGCYFAGCCYGIEVASNHPFSTVYPTNSLIAPPNIPLLNIPLIEATFLITLSSVLAYIYLKSKKIGLSASIYLLAYPTSRFIMEFYRGDIIRGRYGLMTTSQYISVIVFIFGLTYLWRMHRKTKII